MNDDCFMHIQGDKLYGTSIMGQVLWDVLIFPNGLNPSEVRSSLTFLLSDEKSGCAYKKELIKLHALYVGILNVTNLAEFRVSIEYEELIQIENQNRTSR